MLLQMFITTAFFNGIRNPTYFQWMSTFSSTIMVLLALLKAFMPPGVWSNKEKSLLSKIKNISWTFIVVSGLFTCLSTGIIFIIGFFWRIYPFLPPFNQKLTIILYSFWFSCIVLGSIFICKNCLDKSKQVRLKCVVLSIGFFLYFLLQCICSYVLFLPNYSHIGNGGIAMYSFLIYMNLSFAILFANAAFTVTKLTDIVNFDVMTSKNRFFQVYAHFRIVLGPIIAIVTILLSASTMYYN